MLRVQQASAHVMRALDARACCARARLMRRLVRGANCPRGRAPRARTITDLFWSELA